LLRLLQLGRQLPGVLLWLLRRLRTMCLNLLESIKDIRAAGH